MFEVRALLDISAKTTRQDMVHICGRETMAEQPRQCRDLNGHKVSRYRWMVANIKDAVFLKEILQTADGVSISFREAST